MGTSDVFSYSKLTRVYGVEIRFSRRPMLKFETLPWKRNWLDAVVLPLPSEVQECNLSG